LRRSGLYPEQGHPATGGAPSQEKDKKMKDNQIPWPRKGDQLFKADVDWWHNACLNYLPDQWGVYADGYKRAADLLVELVGNMKRDQDILVFPIAFVYRQYIELRLKELVKNGNLLLGIGEKAPQHHKIDQLWRHARSIMEHAWPDGPVQDLDAVEACIRQFSERDPSSTAFRYPTDKAGNPSLDGLKHVNLRNLSEVMERLASLLDGASMAISHYLDQKWEMEQQSAW